MRIRYTRPSAVNTGDVGSQPVATSGWKWWCGGAGRCDAGYSSAGRSPLRAKHRDVVLAGVNPILYRHSVVVLFLSGHFFFTSPWFVFHSRSGGAESARPLQRSISVGCAVSLNDLEGGRRWRASPMCFHPPGIRSPAHIAGCRAKLTSAGRTAPGILDIQHDPRTESHSALV